VQSVLTVGGYGIPTSLVAPASFPDANDLLGLLPACSGGAIDQDCYCTFRRRPVAPVARLIRATTAHLACGLDD
jgi:hypothetical protein